MKFRFILICCVLGCGCNHALLQHSKAGEASNSLRFSELGAIEGIAYPCTDTSIPSWVIASVYRLETDSCLAYSSRLYLEDHAKATLVRADTTEQGGPYFFDSLEPGLYRVSVKNQPKTVDEFPVCAEAWVTCIVVKADSIAEVQGLAANKGYLELERLYIRLTWEPKYRPRER